jgi:predicted GNAT family N-acyltransferase
LSKFRGFGVGQEMVRAVLAAIPADAGYIYLHAQLDAVSLYARFGFEKNGPEFEEAGIRHYKMVRK